MDDLMQSKRESLIESNANTWIGLIGSFAITAICNFGLIPVMGVWWSTAVSVVGCTVWSLVRGYYIRRYFNNRQKRRVQAANPLC